MKLCKDCKYYLIHYGNGEICGRILSLVNGDPFETCHSERYGGYGKCGEDGKFHEPVKKSD